MTKSNLNEWRRGRKCLFKNFVRFIFLTKHRKALTPIHLNRLKDIFEETCKQMKCELVDFQGENDHVLLSVSFPPTLSISTLAGKLKGKSSHFLMKEFEDLKDKIIENHFWSSSYCAVSYNDDSLKNIAEFLSYDRLPVKKM